MKSIKNIKLLMVVGLLLQVSFAYGAKQGQAILNRIEREKGNVEAHSWKPTGLTVEDIRAATEVENLAAKGSREDKLISAVKNGDLKKVETCIAAGAGLEAKDNEDMTALMIAAKMGYTDIVSKLINAGANVHAGNKFGMTSLFMATEGSHVGTVRVLMAAGAASGEREFESIFMSAVFKGNTEMVKALITKDADIDCDTLNTAYMMVNRRNTELVNIISRSS